MRASEPTLDGRLKRLEWEMGQVRIFAAVVCLALVLVAVLVVRL